MRMFKDAEEAVAFTREQDVKFVDVRFCDLPGVMQHFNIPVEAFVESAFTDGLFFDGSSIRGFQAIHESDMKLIPDVTTAYVDPFRKQKTLIVNFSIVDPLSLIHISEPTRLGMISYAVFCLKKKKKRIQ